MRREKSLRIVVHHADAVVRGPVERACTADAEPASKRFPARQHSMTARIMFALAFGSGCSPGPYHAPGVGSHMSSISRPIGRYSAVAISFSSAFIPANRSSKPRARSRRSFSRTMSSSVAPSPGALSSNDTDARYAS
eukprot:31494-Pelagococcus_subviridis.AAC.9